MELKRINTVKNPFLLFLPFFIFYIVLILILANPSLYGDEGRYLKYARNLTHGFYSSPEPFLDLGNSPGYSLIMVPFVALKLPLISIKLLNALFYYLSVVFLFKALRRVVSYKFSIIFSILWALYPNNFKVITHALPEVFSCSLIPLLIFFITFGLDNEKSKNSNFYVIAAGVTFGYLALTKPIFGYVIFTMIIGTIVMLVFNKKSTNYKKSLIVVLIAFLTTLPWLGYTYHMTGKLFYWGTSGGNNLYWMSSPFKNEFGDWKNQSFDSSTEIKKGFIPGSSKIMQLQHGKDFQSILENPEAKKLYSKNGEIYGSPYTGVIQDDVLKRIAIENIKSHPLKFLQNCISNVGRMIFNYPASYTIQKPSTLKRMPVNGTLIVFSAFCFIMTLLYWKKIIFPIRFLLFFGFIYFGGSILGSAEPRMFTPVVPILLIWIAYILQNTVTIKAKFADEN